MTTRVGLLGATGAVGQRFVQLLEPHPEFDLAVLTASDESAGKPYREAAKWRVDTPIPEALADEPVVATTPSAVSDDVELVFSALPSDAAAAVEPAFAEAGFVVCSNASNDREADDVPLVIPEVNADHLGLLDVQRDTRGWDGALVKNPNCSTITLVPTLAALVPFGLERVRVATLQAVSGAGYSGVTSMEIIDNALPHIAGEAEKIAAESRKLLGTFDGDEVVWHDADVSASCNRIATIDGHLENVWAELADDVTPEAAAEAMRSYPSLDLHSSPEPLITVFDAMDRPQPRLDRLLGGGMGVSAGGIEAVPGGGLKYNCLAHNTIRGAAGASVLNGELLIRDGWV